MRKKCFSLLFSYFSNFSTKEVFFSLKEKFFAIKFSFLNAFCRCLMKNNNKWHYFWALKHNTMKIDFSKYYDTIIWIVVSFFIISLPAIWADKTLLDASQLSRQLALSFFLPILALAVIVLLKNGYRFSLTLAEKIIFGGIAVFMLMHFVSSINAINHHEAIFRTAKEFMFIVWFFLIYQMLVAKPNGHIFLIKSIVLMGCFFMGIAVYQITQSDFSSFSNADQNLSYHLNKVLEKVYSTCSNKNLFASILFLITPLSAYCIYHSIRSKGKKWISALWIIISIITFTVGTAFIVILQTRAVYAATAIAALLGATFSYIYLFAIRPRKTGKLLAPKIKAALLIAPIALIVVLSAVIGLTETKIEKMITERIMLTINPEKYHYRSNETGETAIAMRTIIWDKTIEMIKEQPLIGAGPGQWQILIPKYGVDEFNESLREGSLTYQRPHNDFLWYAAEVGLIGLIGYLVFFIGTIYIGIRNITKAPDGATAFFNIIAISTIIGMALIMSVDYPHERIEHNIIYLSILALILASFKSNTKPEAAECNCRHRTSATIGIMAICLIICGLGIHQSWTYYQGEHNARRILTAHYNQNWNLEMQLTRNVRKQSYTLNNYTVPMPYYRGFAESMLGKNDMSIADFKLALEMNPYHILTTNALGTAYSIKGDHDKAIETYNKVLNISPRNIDALTNISVSYLKKKEFDKAINHLRRVNPKSNFKPTNYRKICLLVCRYSALNYKELYDVKKLSDWLNDEDRILASLEKYQHRNNIAWSEFLLPELGK